MSVDDPRRVVKGSKTHLDSTKARALSTQPVFQAPKRAEVAAAMDGKGRAHRLTQICPKRSYPSVDDVRFMPAMVRIKPIVYRERSKAALAKEARYVLGPVVLFLNRPKEHYHLP